MSSFMETAKENLSFLATCFLIFLLLVLLAKILERLLCKERHLVSKAKYTTIVAMCSATAFILMLFEIPVFFAPSFYKIDLSELPVLICTFYLGPTAGVICEFIKIFLKLFIKGTTTAFVGDFANFAVGCTFIIPAAAVYHAHKTRKNALLGLVMGTLCMALFGTAFNAVYLLPKFASLYGMPMDALIAMGTAINPNIHSITTFVFWAVLPLNILKGAIVSALTFILYKRVEKHLFQRKT